MPHLTISDSLCYPPLRTLETLELLHSYDASCSQRPQKFPSLYSCVFISLFLHPVRLAPPSHSVSARLSGTGVCISMTFSLSLSFSRISFSLWQRLSIHWGHEEVSLMIFPLLHLCNGLETIDLPWSQPGS